MFAENVNFAANMIFFEQHFFCKNIFGLMGEVKMLPFYFGREPMFCESDFQIPGTVSAGTRAISFKVIPDFLQSDFL